jgi:serine/threonine protein kinase
MPAEKLTKPDEDTLADPPVTLDPLQTVAPGGGNESSSPVSFASTPHDAELRYRNLRPFAKGGLGEVFLALDSELDREVAVKEIQHAHADNSEARRRFLQEAYLTGQLEHPGVVTVYGRGSYADGRPYYAMRLIRGQSFSSAIAEFHQTASSHKKNPIAFRKLLRHLIDACNAIAYSHSKGIIHRDIKPSNVMLGEFGETLVVDWGLAKRWQTNQANDEIAAVTAIADSSSTGCAGTPQYMSPEQAQSSSDVGPASDIYSLGATLYTVLTGRSPFANTTTIEETLRLVAQGTFAAPLAIDRTIPSPLESICLKAMASKPTDRYASARDLASDIDRWLADEPVAAHPESFFDRLWRYARKHPAVILLAAVTSVFALPIAASLFYILGAAPGESPIPDAILATSVILILAAVFAQIPAMVGILIGFAIGVSRWYMLPGKDIRIVRWCISLGGVAFAVGFMVSYTCIWWLCWNVSVQDDAKPVISDSGFAAAAILHASTLIGAFLGTILEAIQAMRKPKLNRHWLRSLATGAAIGLALAIAASLLLLKD